MLSQQLLELQKISSRSYSAKGTFFFFFTDKRELNYFFHLGWKKKGEREKQSGLNLIEFADIS